MKVIFDTNIFLAVALEEPERQNILEVTQGCSAVAPDLLLYEIGNALSAMLKRKQISSEEVLTCFNLVSQIPVQLLDIDIAKAIEIAIEHNIYAYDAYFLQSALQYHLPLMSLDRKMVQVAKKLSIKILEI